MRRFSKPVWFQVPPLTKTSYNRISIGLGKTTVVFSIIRHKFSTSVHRSIRSPH